MEYGSGPALVKGAPAVEPSLPAVSQDVLHPGGRHLGPAGVARAEDENAHAASRRPQLDSLTATVLQFAR